MKKQVLGFGYWVLGLAYLTFSIFVVLRELARGGIRKSRQVSENFKLYSGQTRVQYEGRPWRLYGLLFFIMVFLQCMVLPTGVFAQERLAVTSKIANVRSGPGTNYDILWRVEKYYPLIVLEKKEGWVHFKDFEGDKAWIHNALVKKINSVITLKDNCNVRSGPGTNTAIVFTVEKGVPFKVIETRGGWLNVEHADGDRGWIFKRLLW
ncbi:MAG: SH3 domain-containing protein [Desulfobacterium sp.]